MAEEFDVTVSGIEETCAALTKLPEVMARGAIGKALAAGAAPIVRTLRIKTPKRTGSLVNHITTDIALDSQGRGGTASVGFGRQGFKARMVEYGHRMVGHKPNKKEIGTVAPQPFMRPTTIAAGDEAIQAFADSLRESVNGGLPGMEKAS